ncbi:MAG: DNA polymerase III subunit delta' [Cyanobacteria bacterium J06634_6]
MQDPFSQLVGQPQAIALLQRVVALQRVAPGYLFVGPAGTGKSLAALGFAQLLLQPAAEKNTLAAQQTILARRIRDRNHPDLLWVEPTYLHQGQLLSASEAAEAGLKRKSPPRIRLPQIRDLARFLSRPALESTRSVVVIEQTERMAEAAANALLKTLEEPGNATVVLIASNQQTLLPTLISRCQAIPFRRLSQADMAQVLQQTGHGEILRSAEVLEIAQGSPGRAIDSWQQLQALPPELLTRVSTPPTTLRDALEVAKEITQTLDTEAQLWLLDYLQHRYWHQGLADGSGLALLEKAHTYLLSYVQPRLVWEVTLSNMASTAHGANSSAMHSSAMLA